VTPLELFGLIVVLGIVRVAMTFVPTPATTAGAGPRIAARSVDAGAATDSSFSTVVKEYLDAFIVAGLVALFLITFVVRTFYIPSGSMIPTLQIHDVLLVNEFEYRFLAPKVEQVVVFPPPVTSDNDFIKRLMATPGDKLRIHDGIVYRNDVALSEPYEAQKPAYELEIKKYDVYVDGVPLDPQQANIPPKSMWRAPDRVPPNCYFMMGDNRNDSEDSHIWGFAQLHGKFVAGPNPGKKAGLTGQAFLVFWPLNRIHILR